MLVRALIVSNMVLLLVCHGSFFGCFWSVLVWFWFLWSVLVGFWILWFLLVCFGLIPHGSLVAFGYFGSSWFFGRFWLLWFLMVLWSLLGGTKVTKSDQRTISFGSSGRFWLLWFLMVLGLFWFGFGSSSWLFMVLWFGLVHHGSSWFFLVPLPLHCSSVPSGLPSQSTWFSLHRIKVGYA